MRVLVIMALLLALVPSAAALQPMGAEHCGSCHAREFKRWESGPHARAGKSLGPRAGEGACESCHGTGDAPSGRNRLANVQCEACHGLGEHYSSEDIMRDPVLAQALGLRSLKSPEQISKAPLWIAEGLCARCHEASVSILPWDPAKSWLRIGH